MTTNSVRSEKPGALHGSTRTPLRQLWQVPVFLAGLVALAGVCIARPTWQEGDLRQMLRDMDKARQVLEHRRAVPGELSLLVERLGEQTSRHPEKAGEIHFLVGSLFVYMAERDPAAAALEAWNKALSHLEDAQTLGVAEADFMRLTFLLAKTWYHTNGNMQDVAEFLERSIEGGADEPAEGYAMLADAYLRLPTRDVEAALRANAMELAVPYVREELLAPARLLRGELLLELKRTDEGRKVLANLGSQAPAAARAKARFLCALSFQDEENWSEAERIWKAALEDQTAPPREPARMLYYLGVCYRKQQQSADAARAFAECAERGDSGDIGIAAALQLAELQLADTDPAPAIETLERVLRDIKGPGDWHNPMVDLQQLREVLENGCEKLRKEGRFEQAMRLAALYEPLAAEGKGQVQLGRAAFESGQRILKAQPEEAQRRFRLAGEALEKASANATVAAERVDHMWQAVEAYAAALDHARSIASIEFLFKLARELGVVLDPQKEGKAWFLRAEAHHALGQETLAMYCYGECINFRSRYAYRARYHQAMARAEEKKIDEARSILEQNLRLLHEEDEPDRDAQEKTLYALAELLYESRDYAAAETHYKQALDKFGNNAAALPALYHLADCYRQLALDELKASTDNVRSLPATKEHHRQEMKRYWGLAVARYQELADVLDKHASAKALDKEAEGLRWRVQMLIAECYYNGEQVPKALAVYQQLEPQYQGKPEQLYVFRGMANCYWATDAAGNKPLALQTVEKIRSLLGKLSDSQLDIGPGSWDRRAWEGWLAKVTTPIKPN
jgi:hypothetical protein